MKSMTLPWMAAAAIGLVFAAGTATAARPSSGPPPIVPEVLGTSSNCTRSFGTGISSPMDGAALMVAGQGVGCTERQPRALLWSAATGMVDLGTIGEAGGGGAMAVSGDGTAVGYLGGAAAIAFVRPPGGPMEALPMLPDMIYAGASDVSQNGEFIVGSNSNDSEGHAVRWDRAGGTWAPTVIPSGSAAAVSNLGQVAGNVPVAGTFEERARIWTSSSTQELSQDDTRANGIDSEGTVVVGYRLADVTCRRPPCGKYPIPMVWTLQSGVWSEQELIALDGVDSEATAVARVNGETVIVGYGYTKRDAVMRAVYWKADAAGQYGAPIRLGGLDGNKASWARATGINTSGRIVGTSGNRRRGSFAVLWLLP